MNRDTMRSSPEVKKVAREIAEEPWAHPFMTVSDPVLRRLGSMLVLQELRIRVDGLVIPESTPRPQTTRERAPRVTATPSPVDPDAAPDTLRSPTPVFDPEHAGEGLERFPPRDGRRVPWGVGDEAHDGDRFSCARAHVRACGRGISWGMNQEELHPIDDTPEPGAFSTLGYLHEQVEQYAEKRDKVRAAETSLKAAENALISARLELTWAKRNLTEAIDKAYLVTHATESRDSVQPIEIPLPPGTNFKAPDPFETPKPTQDFDANDTAYDAPSLGYGVHPSREPKPEIGDYPYAAEPKPDSDPFGGDRPF